MGTNFYIKGKRGNDNSRYHIGKRSAAGWYCWDCGITLCKNGNEGVHTKSEWYSKCPKCGKYPNEESLSDGAAGRELGFNKKPFQKKKGVASCCSFSWARELGRIQKIEDEYGREFTREEFLQMLEECPIQYWGSMGREFS